jgi:hypothetical protein
MKFMTKILQQVWSFMKKFPFTCYGITCIFLSLSWLLFTSGYDSVISLITIIITSPLFYIIKPLNDYLITLFNIEYKLIFFYLLQICVPTLMDIVLILFKIKIYPFVTKMRNKK